MASESSQVTTYRCDAFNCDESLTVAGGAPDITVAAKGWSSYLIPGKDFCPGCSKELRIFLYGESNVTNNESDEQSNSC